MSNPLTFLLPLPYHRVRRVLVIQTGEGTRIGEIVRRVREIFPGASVAALLRESEAGRRAEIAADDVRVARYEERVALLRSLRRERFDVVAYQLDDGVPGGELRRLPFLLRCRSIIAFNPRLDYFPLNVFRLADVAHHFGLAGSPAGASSLARTVVRLLAEAVLRPLTTLYLLALVARIRLGARRRRPAAAGRP
jgi:hypothetical protein